MSMSSLNISIHSFVQLVFIEPLLRGSRVWDASVNTEDKDVPSYGVYVLAGEPHNSVINE